jgi:hypothetical protein
MTFVLTVLHVEPRCQHRSLVSARRPTGSGPTLILLFLTIVAQDAATI